MRPKLKMLSIDFAVAAVTLTRPLRVILGVGAGLVLAAVLNYVGASGLLREHFALRYLEQHDFLVVFVASVFAILLATALIEYLAYAGRRRMQRTLDQSIRARQVEILELVEKTKAVKDEMSRLKTRRAVLDKYVEGFEKGREESAARNRGGNREDQ